jgi:hypothetical protein
MITKKTNEAIDKELARMELREMIAKQDRPTVYSVLRHVSKSGMSRDISLFLVEDNRLRDITWIAGKALGDKVKEKNGRRVIRVNGCGMDMGFHLVYSLSSVTYAYEKERAGYILHHEWA